MNGEALLGQIIGGILVIMGSGLTGYLAARTANKKTEAEKATAMASNEVSAGQLALSMAKEDRLVVVQLRDDMKEMIIKLGALKIAWRAHMVWDDGVIRELERIEPGAATRLPPRPDMPFD